MHRLHAIQFVPREPIALRKRIGLGIAKEIIFFIERILQILERFKLQHHVERHRTAKVLIYIGHALADIGIVLEIVDEPIVERYAADAEDRRRRPDQGDRDDRGRLPARQVAEHASDTEFLAEVYERRCAAHQQQCRREKAERHDKGDGDTQTHHPAKVFDRDDVADRERPECRYRRQRRVQTRCELARHRDFHQVFRVQFFADLQQFTVADDEVNGQRDRGDRQQRDEVGRYDRRRLFQKAQNTHRQHNRYASRRYGQQHPARAAEEQVQDDHDQHHHRAAKDDKVVLDELNHVCGDHGYAAEVQ